MTFAGVDTITMSQVNSRGAEAEARADTDVRRNHSNNGHMDPQPLAYLDREFLDSEEARPLRILAEYLDPLRRFRAQNVQDTVVFFGSARVLSRSLAQRNLRALQNGTGRRKADYKAALKRSHKAVEWSRFYEDARSLAKMLTTWSLSLDVARHRFVVCS